MHRSVSVSVSIMSHSVPHSSRMIVVAVSCIIILAVVTFPTGGILVPCVVGFTVPVPVHGKSKPQQHTNTNIISSSSAASTALHAVSKQQTAIYDGAEFVSIVSYLLLEAEQESNAGKLARWTSVLDYDRMEDAKRMPSKRAGYLTFVVGTVDGRSSYKKGTRVAGIQCHGAIRSAAGNNGNGNEDSDSDSYSDSYSQLDALVWLDEKTAVYADSVAEVPRTIKDADAIATAAAAVCGVHCGMPKLLENAGGEGDTEKARAVVLGGGEYAIFTAKGLRAKGAAVSLVTNRPANMYTSLSNQHQGK
jgi:hypothetical protein